MEIKFNPRHILNILNVLSWIIFLGLCIETGGIIFNTVYALFKPIGAKNFWNSADLSELYAYDKGHFIVQALLMSIAATMKALIFYQIVRLFYNKEVSAARPFSPRVTGVVFRIAYLCLGAGIFSLWGTGYAAWLQGQGVEMPDTHYLRIDGADVWLFMAVVLVVIGLAFKKGTQLQTESDLTV